MRPLEESICLLESAQASLRLQYQPGTTSAASDLLNSPLFKNLITLAKDYLTRSAQKGRAHANLKFITALCDNLINTFSNEPSTIYDISGPNKALGHATGLLNETVNLSIFSQSASGLIKANIAPVSQQQYDKVLLMPGTCPSKQPLIAMHIDVNGVFSDVITYTMRTERAPTSETHLPLAQTVKLAEAKGLFYSFKSGVKGSDSTNSLHCWLREAQEQIGANLSLECSQQEATRLEKPNPKR